MTELILHQYEMSPFSEKVRRILAWKGLAWRPVRAPAVMPKPDLVALTGGYRRIPVLQVGAHVYCDTALIARVLERRAPSPGLYPSPAAEIVAEWADSAFFEVVVPVAMRPTRFDDVLRWLTPEELSKIPEDRAAMRKDGRRISGSAARAILPLYLRRLEGELSAKDFLLGQSPSIADFSVYHSAWFLESTAPESLRPFERLRAWMERLRAPSGTEGAPLSAEEALRVCAQGDPNVNPTDDTPPDGEGPSIGDRVVVSATDYGQEPVDGTLVLSATDEIALRREDPRAGTAIVHFPRIGYEVKRV